MHETARRVVLHIHLVTGVGAQTIKKILERFSHDQLLDLYLMSAHDIAQRVDISVSLAQKITTGLSSVLLLDQEVNLLEKHAITYITRVDSNYPELLGHIHAPPPVLYVKGAPLPNGNRSIACVGARDADSYGASLVRMIVPELVHAGWATISGGARGIDGMVHHATLDAQGTTVAVLGSGLLNLYPEEHRALFMRIEKEGGTLVSEFPLRTAPHAHNFPARNRVIAGLSRATVVMQAAGKSGALITAQHALQEGRDVAAVPGPITHPLSVGCHALIAQGATLIGSVHDMQEFLGERPGAVQHNAGEIADPLLLLCQKPSSLEDLLAHTGLSYSELQERLWNLQELGRVEQTSIGQWVAH